MVDTPTDEYGLRQQGLGDNVNTWGDDKLNEVIRDIAQIIGATKDISITGDYTLTNTTYVDTADTRNYALHFTGTLTAAATITVPSSGAKYLIVNDAGATLTIKTASGTGVSVPTGRCIMVRCNGVNVYSAVPNYQPTSVTLTNNGDLPTYSQVQTLIANAALPATAGTLRNSANDTTANYHAAKHALSVSGALSGAYSTENPGGNEDLLLTLAVVPFALAQGTDQTTSFAPAVNTRYNLTKSADLTVTLPAAPAAKDVIQLEIGGTSGIVTYDLNGLKYYGSTTNPASVAQGVQTFVYHSASVGWIDQ